MMPTNVLNCTRAFLDCEYDNVRKVPPEYFQQLLARLDDASTTARRKHRTVLDIAYGRSSLERLDVFQAGPTGMPVQVFFHGGYWHALDKRDFSFIADGLVPHGVTAVVVNFPLLPGVRMAAQISACRRALRWVYDNIERYGGDPGNLSISGHSAGGHLAAMLLADDTALDGSGEPRAPSIALAHACLISGIYDLEPIRRCFVNDTLQLSVEEATMNSPMRLIPRLACPLAIAVGADEGEEYLRQSRDLVRAWSRPELALRLNVLDNENHFSTRAQFGDPDSEVIKLATNKDISFAKPVPDNR